MELMKSYVTKNECYQVARKIDVKGLMLHSVGVPQPSAKVFATSVYNQYMPNGYEVCVHAFLQSDGKVYQTLPWNYEGWHAGGGDKGSANKTHIGVEMCEPDTIRYTGGASFKVLDAAKAKAYVKGCYETAVELFAYLCDLYDLDPLKDGVIISHAEGYKRGIASGHADPEHLWKGLGMGYTMDGFRKAVKAKMGGTATEPDKPAAPADTSTAVQYTAQVNAPSGLNVRKGPGTSYSVLRALPNGTKVTVTKEQNGWGYIGDGWISLEWGKKIADVSAPAFEPYLFRTTCDVLNIRSGPGTNYPVIGQIKDKKRYTIVEEKTGTGSAKGWGRLKAGLGMGYTMDGFRKAVKAKMGGTATEPAKPAAPADTSTAVQYTAQVNAPSGLNVRKGPGTSYSVLRALPNGTKVTVTKEQNGWGYIGDGWISLEWVKKIADVSAPAFEPYLFRTTCDVLNIRSGPGTNYPVIGQIKDKKRYTIVEEKTGPGSAKGWGRLKAGGWVARDWIKKA